jgi:RNA polymerase sigma factor (sigma-70 family)
MKTESNSGGAPTNYGRFNFFDITQWSMIQRAIDGTSADAFAALETLCRAYWHPLYCYIRRCGRREEDAKDLTQAFFARLLEKNYLAAVDRGKGKFRTFLLAALENFVANEWRYTHAQKRGGGVTFISFDDAFEDTFGDNIADASQDAERILEQQWAIAILNKVLPRLQEDFTKRNSLALFDDIKPTLTGEQSDNSYAEIAAKHNSTEAAIKMVVVRLRKKFGQFLIAELANTVSTQEELEDELRALFAAFN